MMNFVGGYSGLPRPRYRSARAVAPSPSTTGNQKCSVVASLRIFLVLTAAAVFVTTSTQLLPLFWSMDEHLHGTAIGAAAAADRGDPSTPVVDSSGEKNGGRGDSSSASTLAALGDVKEPHHGVHQNVREHREKVWDLIRRERAKKIAGAMESAAAVSGAARVEVSAKKGPAVALQKKNEAAQNLAAEANVYEDPLEAKDPGRSSDLEVREAASAPQRKLARGFSGLPIEKTPALVGAERGTIDCDVNVDMLAYWNSPQGTLDEQFRSPFDVKKSAGETAKQKYLTFELDTGGFNNIRMSLETIFVFAAATGRTLVLPPPQPLYLIDQDAKKKERTIDAFFPIFAKGFKKRVKVITMTEFFDREGGTGGLISTDGMDNDARDELERIIGNCEPRKVSPVSCQKFFEHIQKTAHMADLKDNENCLIFDAGAAQRGPEAVTSPSVTRGIREFCKTRTPVYYGLELADPYHVHFKTGGSDDYRILNHFYAVIYFTDPAIDNYFKRFVRDFLHYNDVIFCAAGRIIQALQEEGLQRGFHVDDEGTGGYSSMHVRRGDLQYKEVIIPAEEWYENTAKLWQPQEILYIATDEWDKQWFAPIAAHQNLRFLDDYWEKAGLGYLDPNYMGMVDIVVASQGRLFVGTWHSTFTAYITRLRGYYGVSKVTNYYSYRPRRLWLHKWAYPGGNYAAREFPIAWLGIDGDSRVLGDLEANASSPIGPLLNLTLLSEPPPRPQYLARGYSGLPISETPSLTGASRGTIECDVNVDILAYWNSPQGLIDRDFVSPFRGSAKSTRRYLSFEPDPGRFNNMRMSLEILLVVAAATGRTVVLPPPQFLKIEDNQSIKSFDNFYSFQSDEFRERLPVITMKEFFEREGGPVGLASLDDEEKSQIMQLASSCENRRLSDVYCGKVYDKIKLNAHVPQISIDDPHGGNCLVFDVDAFQSGIESVTAEIKDIVRQFCGRRTPVYYGSELADPNVLHFDTFGPGRILSHFYSFVLFTNPTIDNHYKRVVRDYIHYNDRIFCAAGKIVRAIQEEGYQRGFRVDEEGGGGYSSLHVRRDDFQYKDVWLTEDKWYENTRDIWLPNEILFISTDEREKKFFDPFAVHHDLRFLDDYWEMANLDNLDPEYLGMIDAIVSSRGRAFAGTYYSTFSGYINRMRGYHGMSKFTSFYSWNPKKVVMHNPPISSQDNSFEREYMIGWVGIDGYKRLTNDNEGWGGNANEQKAAANFSIQAISTSDEKVSILSGKNTSRGAEERFPVNEYPPISDDRLKDSTSSQQLAKMIGGKEDVGTKAKKPIIAIIQQSSHGTQSLEEGFINTHGFLPREDRDLQVSEDGTTQYLVFSTDCGEYQHWQSYLVFFSAMRVRQSGYVVRIASGCTDDQMGATTEWHAEHIEVMSSRFLIHFTPNFSSLKGEGGENLGDYKFFNKPFGVKHWMENALGLADEPAVKDDFVVIIDPDMLLLQPITRDFSSDSVKFWSPSGKSIARKKKVEHGTPFGQTYGFFHTWMKFVNQAGPDSPALKLDERTADLHYQVGPPYIGTLRDMYRIVNRWAELVPKVYGAKPQLLAEMYAYCLAAADLELPHEVVDSMMITDAESFGEGWDLIDAIPTNEVCSFAKTPDHRKYSLPLVVHYCQSYGVKDTFFGKHKTPDDIFSCKSRLLEEPPEDIMETHNEYKFVGSRTQRDDLKPVLYKRNVFIVCAMTSAINEASLFFKNHHCDPPESNKERYQAKG